MCDDSEVARTSSEDGGEELAVRFFFGIQRYFLQCCGVIEEADLPNVIAEESKAATQVAISSGLTMATNMYI